MNAWFGLAATLMLISQSDPVSGEWKGFYRGTMDVENALTLELRLNGDVIEGAVIAEADRLSIEHGKFDEKNRKARFEVFFPWTSARYVVEGTIDAGIFTGTWRHATDHGVFEFRRQGSGGVAAGGLRNLVACS